MCKTFIKKNRDNFRNGRIFRNWGKTWNFETNCTWLHVTEPLLIKIAVLYGSFLNHRAFFRICSSLYNTL